MPLVSAKCTQCGEILEVDNKKEAAICSHCGAAFITSNAINDYNALNKGQNGTQNVVIGTVQGYLKNAQSAYQFEDYEKLEEVAKNILNLDPENLDGIFYTVVCLVENNKKGFADNVIITASNYIKALVKANYKLEELKPYAIKIFKPVFYNYFDREAKHLETFYPKIISIFKALKINVLTDFGCENMYYTIYDISKYMARYIKENNLDYTDVKKEGLLITKPPAKYEHSRNIIKITKDFVYGYSEDLKYSEYYEEYKTITEEGIYYRENVVLEMELFGNYVNINIKDKIKKAYPEPFTKGIFLGEIKIFGGDKKLIRDAYNLLETYKYKVELIGEKVDKLKDIL